MRSETDEVANDLWLEWKDRVISQGYGLTNLAERCFVFVEVRMSGESRSVIDAVTHTLVTRTKDFLMPQVMPATLRRSEEEEDEIPASPYERLARIAKILEEADRRKPPNEDGPPPITLEELTNIYELAKGKRFVI